MDFVQLAEGENMLILDSTSASESRAKFDQNWYNVIASKFYTLENINSTPIQSTSLWHKYMGHLDVCLVMSKRDVAL